MVTLLITALAIFAIIGIGLYFWQKSSPDTSERVLPPPPDARGLFAPDQSALNEEEAKRLAMAAREQAEQLISRAKSGERAVLAEAHGSADAELYDRALNELVQQADSDAKLLALMSHVAQHELPVNEKLAQAALNSWQQSPDRAGTAKALHFAALSNNAGVYRAAVETALRLWQEGKLNDISPVELKALFDGEFWVLSSGARSSGAGFLLKQTLASARRELEAAPRATR
jgi:vacuolar-type H+-ATPase subunit H